MPCPFEVAAYSCEKRNRCGPIFNYCPHAPHMPLNCKKVKNCISRKIYECEKPSGWQELLKSVEMCAKSVEKECCCPNCFRMKCMQYANLSANCNIGCLNDNLYPTQGSRYPVAHTKNTNCSNFQSERRNFTQAKTQTNFPDQNETFTKPTNYINLAKNLKKYCTSVDNNQLATNLGKPCIACNKKHTLTENGQVPPMLARWLNKINYDPTCPNKPLMSDINIQYDDNVDFVHHLWRLCNAKILQNEWENLARCAQTETCKNPMPNDSPTKKSIGQCCHQNDIISETTAAPSKPNHLGCPCKPKTKSFKCGTPYKPPNNAQTQKGQQTNDVPTFYDMSSFGGSIPNSMCGPIILCGAQFDFKPKDLQVAKSIGSEASSLTKMPKKKNKESVGETSIKGVKKNQHEIIRKEEEEELDIPEEPTSSKNLAESSGSKKKVSSAKDKKKSKTGKKPTKSKDIHTKKSSSAKLLKKSKQTKPKKSKISKTSKTTVKSSSLKSKPARGGGKKPVGGTGKQQSSKK